MDTESNNDNILRCPDCNGPILIKKDNSIPEGIGCAMIILAIAALIVAVYYASYHWGDKPESPKATETQGEGIRTGGKP